MTTDTGDGIELGETAAVRLFPLWLEFWRDVEVGSELYAFEGPKLAGKAVVTEIVPPTTTDSV